MLKAEIERLRYEMARHKEAIAARPDWEKLWAEREDEIERLRTGFPWSDLDEAEAEIERLRAQWEHFQKLTSEHRDELEAEIERLRERMICVDHDENGGAILRSINAVIRNDALEEAAKVAEDNNSWPREGEEIAAAIRALKEKGLV